MDQHNELTETNWAYYSARTSTALPRGCELGGFSEHASAPVHRLEVPSSPGVLVLCCGEPLTLQPALRPGSAARLSAFFGGLQAGAQLASHAGHNDCIEMRLPPSAAYDLFGGVVTEGSEVVNLLDVDPLGIGVLLNQLRAASTWQRRFAAVDGFLARRFAESERRIPPELEWAWDVLERAHGQVTIAALAQSVGWSERHFTHRFRAFFGARPKEAARRLRFARAFSLVTVHPQADLAGIAVEAGFSDQSHMTREFGVFAGASPGVLRRARSDDVPGIPATALSGQ